MQVRTPARQPPGNVRNYLISCRHQADQVGLGRALSAPDAGSDRYGLSAVQLTVPLPQRHRPQSQHRPPALYLDLPYLDLPYPAVLNPAVPYPAGPYPAVLNPAVLNPAVLNPAVLNPPLPYHSAL